MIAKETKLQEIIEGTKQYVLPLFQRSYSWDKKEWDIFWEDLIELSELDNPRSHFIGSIVNMPSSSVPEGVSKFLLIDGQQRLTTVFVILTLLRDLFLKSDEKENAAEINNTLLVNPYKRGLDYYKLMPTQVDREDYQALIGGSLINNKSQIYKAYSYFESKTRRTSVDYSTLKTIITHYLSIVSIVLDNDDNPYLVFESLNAKGRPLTQADLIKNYFFMRIHSDHQLELYKKYWEPMETKLEGRMTEYIRHYLMIDGAIVKQDDVYHSLKDRVDTANAIGYLRELSSTSDSYHKMIQPENETNNEIKKYLLRLNRIEVTTVYPLLLNFYKLYNSKILSIEKFVNLLQILENFLIRRFVCGIPTNQLNKLFPSLIIYLQTVPENEMEENLKLFLSIKSYPKNNIFQKSILETKMYGGGDRATKTKLILESIEESFQHREHVSFEELTVEHIMPQTLSEGWQKYLGDDWELIYELHLHNLGNLTLTGYNTVLSNDDFITKREYYVNSHLEINKYFSNIAEWRRSDIETRANKLYEIMVKIWPYFGNNDDEMIEQFDVTGTTPHEITILGQNFEATNWRIVLEKTLNVLLELDKDMFEKLVDEYPKFLNRDKNKLRAIRELNNGYFFEVNLSAKSVEKFCRQAIQFFELSSDDWEIHVS